MAECSPSPTPPKSNPMGESNWLTFHSSKRRGTSGSSGPQPSTKEIISSVPICHSVILSAMSRGIENNVMMGCGKEP